MNAALSVLSRSPPRKGTPARGATIADRIAATSGRTSGFDYLRLLLAVAVISFHSVLISYGNAADTAMWTSWLRPFIRAILPMFFALSGYLVAGSLERSKNVTVFLGLRAIRIYPALGVEVLLSALLLGPLVSSLGGGAYFSSPTFFRYLLNVTGDMHYALPGVFLSNPFPGTVNAQLWTVPYELQCYGWLAVLGVFGVVRRPWLCLISAAALSLVMCLATLSVHAWRLAPRQTSLTGDMLVVSFLAGVCVYLHRDRVPWDGRLAGAAAALAVVTLGYLPLGDYLAPFAVAYLTVYLGLCDPGRISVVRGADYSYGMFLYGFAVQQAFASLGPWAHRWWLSILVCVPASALVAAASWHWVEKPALKLRCWVFRLGQQRLGAQAQAAPAE